MEDLLKQVKASPYYSEIKKKLTESQIKDFLKDYSSQSSSGLDSEGGMTITPSKGYVVKTSDLSSSEKVFINICSHEIVDLPEQKDLPEVEDHLALRVPLSLGNPRPDHDKNGKICTIYDVIVNPAILEKSQEDPTTRQLLIELCVQHIAQKHKQQLSLSMVYLEYRLPKLKYKGTLQQQRVRGKKDPKIEVIDKEVFETPVESLRTPLWTLLLDGCEMDPENLLTFSEFSVAVELDLLISGKSISFKCGEDRIEVSVGKIYFLSLWVPFCIDVGTVKAEFDCKTRRLLIKGRRKVVEEEQPVVVNKLKPVSLSSNDLLFDVV